MDVGHWGLWWTESQSGAFLWSHWATSQAPPRWTWRIIIETNNYHLVLSFPSTQNVDQNLLTFKNNNDQWIVFNGTSIHSFHLTTCCHPFQPFHAVLLWWLWYTVSPATSQTNLQTSSAVSSCQLDWRCVFGVRDNGRIGNENPCRHSTVWKWHQKLLWTAPNGISAPVWQQQMKRSEPKAQMELRTQHFWVWTFHS